MKVREIMTPGVEVIDAAASLQEAGEKMRLLNVGSLPVYDGSQLVGMVTDRDITVRATAEGADPRSALVRDAMTWDVSYVFDDQDVKDAAKLMEDRQIRRLLVVDGERKVVGILSLGDIATEGVKSGLKAEVLEKVSEPSEPERLKAEEEAPPPEPEGARS
jgi:CBS domain-containing protein